MVTSLTFRLSAMTAGIEAGNDRLESTSSGSDNGWDSTGSLSLLSSRSSRRGGARGGDERPARRDAERRFVGPCERGFSGFGNAWLRGSASQLVRRRGRDSACMLVQMEGD
jgi:hypothetical protein